MLFQSSKRFLDRQPGTAFILSFWNGIRLWQNIFPCSPHMSFANIAPCSKPALCYRSLAIGCYHKYTTSLSDCLFQSAYPAKRFCLPRLEPYSEFPHDLWKQQTRHCPLLPGCRLAVLHWDILWGKQDISFFRRSRFSLPDMIPRYVTTCCRLSSLFCSHPIESALTKSMCQSVPYTILNPLS